jgi:hypothetical protein
MALLHAANLRHGAGFYFPSEGSRAEDFFALKNPTASAGYEPANLGTKGQIQMLITGTPKIKAIAFANSVTNFAS